MARHALHAHRPRRRSAARAAALGTLALAGALGTPQVAIAGEYGGGTGSSTGGDSSTPTTPTTPPASTGATADECDGLSARLIALDKALADDDTTADEAASLVSERSTLVADLALCVDLDVDADVDAAGLKLSL